MSSIATANRVTGGGGTSGTANTEEGGPQPNVNALEQILDLEEIDVNLFRGHSPKAPRWGRVYGGQTVAQALVACGRTVDAPFVAHSLHAYFMLAGDDTYPILYQVDRIRDGRSFVTREVVATQRGKAIFCMSASFHIPEPGVRHQQPPPKVADPETLLSWTDVIKKSAEDPRVPPKLRNQMVKGANFYIPFAFDLRRPDEQQLTYPPKPRPAWQTSWMRVKGKMSDSPFLHQCALAYLSDWDLLRTSALPHGLQWGTRGVVTASLDHTMWFHQPFRADEWLLFQFDSPAASSSRALCFGRVYTRDGTLAVTCAQEGLVRVLGSPDTTLKHQPALERKTSVREMKDGSHEQLQFGSTTSPKDVLRQSVPKLGITVPPHSTVSANRKQTAASMTPSPSPTASAPASTAIADTSASPVITSTNGIFKRPPSMWDSIGDAHNSGTPVLPSYGSTTVVDNNGSNGINTAPMDGTSNGNGSSVVDGGQLPPIERDNDVPKQRQMKKLSGGGGTIQSNL